MMYTVVVIREEDGRYTAFVPSLNDVASFGDTLPEALQMVEEAASLYLETLREQEWPIPPDNPNVNVDMSQAAEAYIYKLPIREETPIA
ncbi:MAG: type II toxin-antitoxin system HicB family antitoxin [bacterium]